MVIPHDRELELVPYTGWEPIFKADLDACKGSLELLGLLAWGLHQTHARDRGLVDEKLGGFRARLRRFAGCSESTAARLIRALEALPGVEIDRAPNGVLRGITTKSVRRFKVDPKNTVSQVTPSEEAGPLFAGVGAGGRVSPVTPKGVKGDTLIPSSATSATLRGLGDSPRSIAEGVTGDTLPFVPPTVPDQTDVAGGPCEPAAGSPAGEQPPAGPGMVRPGRSLPAVDGVGRWLVAAAASRVKHERGEPWDRWRERVADEARKLAGTSSPKATSA